MTDRPKSSRHATSSTKALPNLPPRPHSPRGEGEKTDDAKKAKSKSSVKDKTQKSGTKSKKDKEEKPSNTKFENSVELTPENQAIVDEFVDYAWNNQLQELKNLMPKVLESKIINGLNVRGQSALYCAARNGHSRILIELLNANNAIDVNVRATPHGGTPLHAAGVNGKTEAVALLLACGANRGLKNSSGQSVTEGVNAAVMDVYEAFSEGLIVKTCEALVTDFPILKELSYVQQVLQRVELMKQKALQKQLEQERALQEAAAKEEAEGIASQPGFQFGAKKNVEKVFIDYSKLSSAEQEEHIMNLGLSKSSYTFANDMSDVTSFLSYCNNPALAAQSVKNNADLADKISGDSQDGGVDKDILSRIDSLLFSGVPEIQKTKEPQFSQSGVIESLGFNPLFFNGSVFIVEEEGKTHQGGILSSMSSTKSL